MSLRLPAIPVVDLSTDSDSACAAETVALCALLRSSCGVLDFWHTRCVKCPAALEKLNQEAEQSVKNCLTLELLPTLYLLLQLLS